MSWAAYFSSQTNHGGQNHQHISQHDFASHDFVGELAGL